MEVPVLIPELLVPVWILLLPLVLSTDLEEDAGAGCTRSLLFVPDLDAG